MMYRCNLSSVCFHIDVFVHIWSCSLQDWFNFLIAQTPCITSSLFFWAIGALWDARKIKHHQQKLKKLKHIRQANTLLAKWGLEMFNQSKKLKLTPPLFRSKIVFTTCFIVKIITSIYCNPFSLKNTKKSVRCSICLEYPSDVLTCLAFSIALPFMSD